MQLADLPLTTGCDVVDWIEDPHVGSDSPLPAGTMGRAQKLSWWWRHTTDCCMSGLVQGPPFQTCQDSTEIPQYSQNTRPPMPLHLRCHQSLHVSARIGTFFNSSGTFPPWDISPDCAFEAIDTASPRPRVPKQTVRRWRNRLIVVHELPHNLPPANRRIPSASCGAWPCTISPPSPECWVQQGDSRNLKHDDRRASQCDTWHPPARSA
jgi:hypothetical protein